MSGLEVLGVASSIIQVADFGLRLSKRIYDFADSVASADSRLTRIGRHVDLTSEVVKQVADVFSADVSEKLVNQQALKLGQDAAEECEEVFAELMGEVAKLRRDKRQFYKFPFKEEKLLLMESRLEKLKTTLSCLMNVLLLGKAVKENNDDPLLREQVAQLAREKEAVTKKYEDLLRASEGIHYSSPIRNPLLVYAPDMQAPAYQGVTSPPPANDETITKSPPSTADNVTPQGQEPGNPLPSASNNDDLNRGSSSRLPNPASSNGTSRSPKPGTVVPNKRQDGNGSSASGASSHGDRSKSNPQTRSSRNPGRDTKSGDAVTIMLEECAASVEDLLETIDTVLGSLRRQSRDHVRESEIATLSSAYSQMRRTLKGKLRDLPTREPNGSRLATLLSAYLQMRRAVKGKLRDLFTREPSRNRLASRYNLPVAVDFPEVPSEASRNRLIPRDRIYEYQRLQHSTTLSAAPYTQRHDLGDDQEYMGRGDTIMTNGRTEVRLPPTIHLNWDTELTAHHAPSPSQKMGDPTVEASGIVQQGSLPPSQRHADIVHGLTTEPVPSSPPTAMIKTDGDIVDELLQEWTTLYTDPADVQTDDSRSYT